MFLVVTIIILIIILYFIIIHKNYEFFLITNTTKEELVEEELRLIDDSYDVNLDSENYIIDSYKNMSQSSLINNKSPKTIFSFSSIHIYLYFC
jgi:hypothetical protein